jgi:hypothetical protein
LNVPDTDGVPLIVTPFEAQVPVTPVGRPEKVAPVARVVLYEILVIGVLIQSVWLVVLTAEVREIVLFGLTVIVPVAVAAEAPHPPVRLTV